MNKELLDFLKSDRQWLRVQRIAHAKLQLRCARKNRDTPKIEFWKGVLTANGSVSGDEREMMKG